MAPAFPHRYPSGPKPRPEPALAGSDKALVPLGLVAGRTWVISDAGTALDLNVGYYTVNRLPTGGPNRQFKFGVSFFL